VKIEVDDLKDFNPLQDAVVLPDDPVQIFVQKEVSIDMMNQHYHLEEGAQEIPTYLAVFLIGRKGATLL
jgi:hypothetical protein